MEKYAKIFMLTFKLNMDYYLVHRDNKEENTMQKINISCGSVNLIMATDSNEIINFFLHNRDTVRETIPGVEVKKIDSNVEMVEPYIIYTNSNDRKVVIDSNNNKAIIRFPIQELFFPDLVYLVLSMMSKELNKLNKYFIHCSIVEKNNKGIMIVGDPGSGKTTLSLYLSMNNNFDFVCNDRALLEFFNGVPYVTAGTLETSIRVGVIPQFFPLLMEKINTSSLENPWNSRFYLNPEFENLGIKVKSSTPITHVLFTLTYPTTASQTRLEKYDNSKRQDVSILKTMGCFSQYIRANNNMLISAEYPFPSFDTTELAYKRLKDVKRFVQSTEMYSARGDIKSLANMIDQLVV